MAGDPNSNTDGNLFDPNGNGNIGSNGYYYYYDPNNNECHISSFYTGWNRDNEIIDLLQKILDKLEQIRMEI